VSRILRGELLRKAQRTYTRTKKKTFSGELRQGNAHGCKLPDTESGNRRCENPCPNCTVSAANPQPSESLHCLRHILWASALSAALLRSHWRRGNFGHRKRPSGPPITALGPQRSGTPRSPRRSADVVSFGRLYFTSRKRAVLDTAGYVAATSSDLLPDTQSPGVIAVAPREDGIAKPHSVTRRLQASGSLSYVSS
jgi:hypothetical protein